MQRPPRSSSARCSFARVRDRTGAVRLRHVRHRVHRSPDRLVPVRALRRPHRPQVDARRIAARDGRVHHRHRLRARLRRDRRASRRCCYACCASARGSASAANGRRRAARVTSTRRREARLVRDVPAARAIGRLPDVERLSSRSRCRCRTSSSAAGAGASVPGRCGARRARPVRAARSPKHPRSKAALDRKARARAGRDADHATLAADAARCACDGRLLHAVLHLDGVLAVLRRVGAAYSAPGFLGLLCFAVVVHGLATPLSAWASDRFGRKPVLVGAIAALLSGLRWSRCSVAARCRSSHCS